MMVDRIWEMGVVRGSSEHALIEFFGEVAAIAMLEWAYLDERTLSLPVEPWKATGFTEAFAASVIVGAAQPDEHDRYLVAKVVPKEEGRERRVHLAALRTGEFADQHLVKLFGPPILCPSGQVVFFQELAGLDRRFRPASTLADTEASALVEQCEQVIAGVSTMWNPAAKIGQKPLDEFVLAELRHPISGVASVEQWAGDLGLGHPDTAWLCTPDNSGPLPNPVLFGYGHPALVGRKIDLLTCHGHGDLHLGNLMVLRDGQDLQVERYQLIDLSTYTADAPRGRDEITLLLSAIAWLWPSLSDLHRIELLTEMTRPDTTPHVRQDRLLVRLVAAAFDTTLSTVRPAGFDEAWRRQYPLVLMSTALRFTTFSNLPGDLRWWLVRLACHAARAYVDLVGVEVPDNATHTLTNPFPSASDVVGGLEPAPSAVSWDGLSAGGYTPFSGDGR